MIDFILELQDTLKQLDNFTSFFLGVWSVAVVGVLYCFTCEFCERIGKVVGEGFACLCKKGFALVKRKFGKEK